MESLKKAVAEKKEDFTTETKCFLTISLSHTHKFHTVGVAPFIKMLNAAHSIASRSDVTPKSLFPRQENFRFPYKKTSVPKSPINIAPY